MGDNIKVIDKRMFTPDGELRRDLETPKPAESPSESADSQNAPRPTAASEPQPPAGYRSPSAPSDAAAPAGPAQGTQPEAEPSPHGFEAPGFVHLVSMLAEPVAIYLGDVEMEGGPGQNLELARIHIDLLEVLQEKTRGNLSQEEDRYLEGLLYQLRMRYLQKKK